MCRIHTTEELANILDVMADLFAWKHRRGLSAAAAVARTPSQGWRPQSAAGDDAAETAEIDDRLVAPAHPAWLVGSKGGSAA